MEEAALVLKDERLVRKEHRWQGGGRLGALTTAVVVCVALLGVLDVGVGWSSGGRTSQATQSSLSALPPWKLSAQQVQVLRAHAARHRYWLASPRVRTQRAASRTEFRGMRAPAAKALLSHDYGAVLASAAANPATAVARSGRVV